MNLYFISIAFLISQYSIIGRTQSLLEQPLPTQLTNFSIEEGQFIHAQKSLKYIIIQNITKQTNRHLRLIQCGEIFEKNVRRN